MATCLVCERGEHYACKLAALWFEPTCDCDTCAQIAQDAYQDLEGALELDDTEGD